MPDPSEPRPSGAVTVSRLQPHDVAGAVALHQQGLANELVARLGTRTLRHYHQAYLRSPSGLSLVAHQQGSDQVLGFLLGAVDPPVHYRFIVSTTGTRLALATAAHAATHPALAAELVRTRALRWARGVVRVLLRSRATSSPDAPGDPVDEPGSAGSSPAGTAEVTHVVVAEHQRGRGVGRALLQAALGEAAAGGARRAELVTPVDDDAAIAFYDACGWRRDGEIRSRSGETFLRFVTDLPAPGGAATTTGSEHQP